MIFSRSVVREIASNAGSAFSVLFCIVFTQVLIRVLSDATAGDVDTHVLFSVVALTTLTNLALILTLSVFIAVLMALSRAFRDSEMVVWFAAGQSLTAWIAPVLRFVVPVALFIATMTFVISPWAEQTLADTRDRFEHRDDVSKVAPGRFMESGGADRVFFVENLDLEGTPHVQGVFASQRNGDRNVVIVANEGHVETRPDGARFLILDHGRRYDIRPGDAANRIMEFERYAVRLESAGGMPLGNRSARTLSTLHLLKVSTPSNRGELLFRVALPVAAVVLSLLAIPLAHVNPRVGRSVNIIMAALMALIYLNTLLIMQSHVQHGKLPFAVAVVLPHLVAGGLAVALFARRLSVRRWRLWPRMAGAR
jgi:lipopolysaccharide export system permease protein